MRPNHLRVHWLLGELIEDRPVAAALLFFDEIDGLANPKPGWIKFKMDQVRPHEKHEHIQATQNYTHHQSNNEIQDTSP